MKVGLDRVGDPVPANSVNSPPRTVVPTLLPQDGKPVPAFSWEEVGTGFLDSAVAWGGTGDDADADAAEIVNLD